MSVPYETLTCSLSNIRDYTGSLGCGNTGQRPCVICLAGTEEDGILWAEAGCLVGSGPSTGRPAAGGLTAGLLIATKDRGSQLAGAGRVDYIAGVERIIGGNWVSQVTSKRVGGEVSRAAVVMHVEFWVKLSCREVW